MKFNWRVLVAFVVLVGTIAWAVNSLRSRSYSGTDLSFGVGSGPVTVTNSTDAPISARLVGSQVGTFAVSSNIEGVAGRSTSQGSGRNTTQLFEFALPPGISEFAVSRSAGVNFVTHAVTPLEATVQPLNAADSLITLIIAAAGIIGSLFYLSRSGDRPGISTSRRQRAFDRAARPETNQQIFERVAGRVTHKKP